MTEAEENDELMTSVNEADNDDEFISHFDASPWCKSNITLFLLTYEIIER